MSLFQWCAQEQITFKGKFCGHGLGRSFHKCRFPNKTVTTAFASGGLILEV